MLHSYLYIEDSLNIDDVVLVIITNDINCCRAQVQVQVRFRSGEGQVRVRKVRVRSESCEIKDFNKN